MSDQSSLLSVRAAVSEVTEPLGALHDDPLSITRDTDFPIALRGYDRDAVDAYIKRSGRLIAELYAARSPEAAVRRALDRVGEEVAEILSGAHETAERITKQSRKEAENRVQAAQREAERIPKEAEERLRALDADTDRVWEERRRIIVDARELAGELLGLADAAAERFAPEDGVVERESAADESRQVTQVMDAQADTAPDPLASEDDEGEA